ncbi:transposase [Dolichospermum sp. ST_con]|nr:transposase [Dolichospermum sp. ST_con]
MSHYINDTYKDEEGKLKNLRPEIRDITKKECEENKTIYSSNIVDNAVLHAKQTFNSVCDKNKKNKGNKNGFAKLKYKSKKGTTHSFKIDRLPVSGYPYSTILGKAHITEKIPQEAYDKTCVITGDKKRWYINVQQHTIIKSEIQGQVKCVSVDQGVRTFATTYSPHEVAFIGEDFAKTKLFPLMKEVDQFISQKQKLLNQFKNVKFNDLPQWTRDRVVCIEKQINKIKCRKEDLVSDLYHKFANYLLSNFDCIFLPHFETRQMVKRQGKVRTIRRNTARQMLDLGHYKFKVLIKWLAKKYGKKVIDCNESNTSKTRSWNGTIDEKLGSKKIIKDEYIVVHRDVNGARGIYLKCVTTVA